MKYFLRLAAILTLGVFVMMSSEAAKTGDHADATKCDKATAAKCDKTQAGQCDKGLTCPRNDAAAETLGWKLGIQAWTFHTYTLKQAIDNAAALQLRYLEAFPGQALGGDQPEGAIFVHGMSPEQMQVVNGWLKDAGVKLINYGVVGLSADEAENRKVFDFAKAMGIETIASEPPFDAFDVIEKLADEYEINIAIHNHPTPSPYWNPQTVLDQIKGRSARLGACADTGHWMRSGIDPIEALKMLEGRIISLHFKDLSERKADGHDVPWGSGAGDPAAIFDELNRQSFKGVFSIEYEHNWEKSMPEIAQCVTYFDTQAARIADAAKK